jgi:hypothetical protein
MSMSIETESRTGCRRVADVEPAGGDHDPVELAVLRRVPHRGAAAQDVRGIAEPPQQAGVVEVAGLLAGVRHDHARVGDQQAAPHLFVLVPGLGLRTDDVRTGQDERSREVVPVGLAGEGSDLEVVPGRPPTSCMSLSGQTGNVIPVSSSETVHRRRWMAVSWDRPLE